MSLQSTKINFNTRPLMRPGRQSLKTLALILVACAAWAGKPAHADAIKFCVDRANPMFAVDEAVANAAAATQNVSAQFIVRDSSKSDEDQDSGAKQAKFFKTLVQSCDLIMGFPVESKYSTLPKNMRPTLTYARTGFVAVTNGAPVRSFDTLVNNGQVGVEFLTVASTYFNADNASHEHIFYSNDELYNALMTHEVSTIVVWQPWLLQQLAQHPQDVSVSNIKMPHAVWNIVGIYASNGKPNLGVQEFNAGVMALRKSGKLAQDIAPYKTPMIDE